MSNTQDGNLSSQLHTRQQITHTSTQLYTSNTQDGNLSSLSFGTWHSTMYLQNRYLDTSCAGVHTVSQYWNVLIGTYTSIMWWDFNIKICRRTSTCQVRGARCDRRVVRGVRCKVSGARCHERSAVLYHSVYIQFNIPRGSAAGYGYTVLASRPVHGANPIISSNFILCGGTST